MFIVGKDHQLNLVKQSVNVLSIPTIQTLGIGQDTQELHHLRSGRKKNTNGNATNISNVLKNINKGDRADSSAGANLRYSC